VLICQAGRLDGSDRTLGSLGPPHRQEVRSLGNPEKGEKPPAFSICPQCEARLVTKNLWPTCGPSPSKACFPSQSPPYLILLESTSRFSTLGDVQVAGWTARGSSRPQITDRGGGLISSPFGLRSTSTMSSGRGFRNRTTSWECRAICGASVPCRSLVAITYR
jgi:hypothetical protein